MTAGAALVLGVGGGSALALRAIDRSRGEQEESPLSSGSVDAGQPVTEFAAESRAAPVDLSGTTLSGEPLDLTSLRGGPVVLNVWGSWCAPCREEAPVLVRLSSDYATRRVSFVGLNVKDNPAAARAFEDRFGVSYPSIDDGDGRGILALSQYVPASAVPVTLVLDAAGRVAARVLGAVREATLRALLDAVLSEKGGS
ncbi:TlpA disulfide reductase family protein [Thalassiella azotivora]